MTPEEELDLVTAIEQLKAEQGCDIPPEAVDALLTFLNTIV